MKDHSVYVEEPDVVELNKSKLAAEIAGVIGRGDMGPGISLSSALVLGMDGYYPGDRKGAANCVAWALQQAAQCVITQYVSTPPVTVDDLEVATAAFVSKACELTGDDQERALLWLKGDTDERSVFEKCIRAALEAIRNRKGDDR